MQLHGKLYSENTEQWNNRINHNISLQTLLPIFLYLVHVTNFITPATAQQRHGLTLRLHAVITDIVNSVG